nr:RNA-directed DNA polymerase, eukaryota, reverse transcriptase zinc-binding domain protein [Tanacetum cinerariifolium]
MSYVQACQKTESFEKQVDQNPHNANLKKQEAEILKEYNNARKDKEKLLIHKAKIDWLSDGDKNSKFFHSVLKRRAHKSRIETVQNENRDRFKRDQVAKQFLSHFQNFLGKAVNVENIDMESLKSRTVCADDAEKMIMNVSDKEIKYALFDICDNKALGPDGYSAKLFKSSWSVTMSKTPQKVSDYRPIACCNVLYKIISKILTNRIKSTLCKLISPSQSAFIPGRQITDNILLTQELLRGYNWKNGARR